MKTALIIVDIQNDYFPGGRMALVGMDAAAAKAAEALAYFRGQGWPTFHIRHIATGSGATFFLPGTEGAEIHESVAPRRGERIIEKHYPNSFRETPLLDELREAAVEEVVVTGAMSHMCVDASTRAAADFGLRCKVVHDACATRDLQFGGRTIPAAEVHGSFMAALGAAYGQVLSLEELLARVPSGD